MLARRPARLLAALALLLAPGFALGQSEPPAPPHVPLQKTIGQARPEVVPSLIVMNAGGATLEGSTLTLTGVAANAIVFADRPVRAAGHALTMTLLDEWNPDYPDSFAADPPNATVSVLGAIEDEIRDAVVVLRNPQMQGADLVFEVDVLEGSLAGAEGPAALFIDIIGRPLTPLSFAGVARRTAFRSAWYAGAAAAAADPYYPHAPYGRSPCGYPPYPPCY
jgi:hypothetical protein